MIATGLAYRRLEAPGVEEVIGCGVSYGSAAAEAARHRDQDVVLVGGANSAGQAALHLAAYARSVTMTVRSDSLQAGMSRYLLDRIIGHPKITVLTRTRVIAAGGQGQLETVTVADRDGHRRELQADAMYVLIGGQPLTAGVEGWLRRADGGYLITGAALHRDSSTPSWPVARDPLPLESSQPGGFVAGDVRHGSINVVGLHRILHLRSRLTKGPATSREIIEPTNRRRRGLSSGRPEVSAAPPSSATRSARVASIGTCFARTAVLRYLAAGCCSARAKEQRSGSSQMPVGGAKRAWELGAAPSDERGTACGLERVMLESR